MVQPGEHQRRVLHGGGGGNNARPDTVSAEPSVVSAESSAVHGAATTRGYLSLLRSTQFRSYVPS